MTVLTLLDTYDAGRRPVALATSARASARSVEHKHPGYDVGAVGPGGGRQPGMLAVVLGYRYASSAVPVVQAGGPAGEGAVPLDFRPVAVPGGRAPHLWFTRAGARMSTLDLYEDTSVLLSGPEDGAWHAAGERVGQRLGVPLSCLRVGHGAEHDLAPEPGADGEGLHGVAADGAVLVRPDGFVAWRSGTAVPEPAPLWRTC
ncbi:hypothetical protein E6W39_11655 [Kitasatospora acidiphila]|uniref:Monooxygenase n=1 Tax=Kitasatospora acidiphila TaxID=2567942 RepID=A0A540W1B5_9ACTN|nr:hypothetical protein [Kitasatospora acidiphila]TQF02793.1 hypothetical protein E6W39_11655 [Kitasatospora acidiphila]